MQIGAAHEPSYAVAYSVAKAADDRLALTASAALVRDGVASVSLYPGLVRTEGVMQFAEHLDLAGAWSPEGIGRVVAALADTLRPVTGQQTSRSDSRSVPRTRCRRLTRE